MSEQQFADAVGVSRGAVQQWEKPGGTAPKRANQPRVAKLLGLSVAELVSGGSNTTPGMDARAEVGLELHEARRIVAVMKPIFVEAGAVLMREGQTEKADFMLLLLEGQIRAESRDRARGEPDQVISVLDPGALIGEMSLVDDGPRSATCIALTDLTLAGLSRNALRRLIEAHPALGARLLLLLAQSTSLKLRETNRRLRAMTQITRAMQRELDATHAVNRRLLDAG